MSVRRFFAGETIASFGDWFTYVGIGVLAVGQPHGALALAVVLIAQAAPRAILAPVAGALADRADRRGLLVIASLGRALAATAMVAAALADRPWLVEGCYVARMALGTLTDAAGRAMLPALVEPSRLARVNALLGLAWNATFVLGVLAGGITVARAGVAAAFAVDAITFVVAAAIFATLPRVTGAPAPRATGALRSDELRLVLAKVPVSIATGAAWIALHESIGSIAIGLGLTHAIRAAGAGIAPLVWPRAWGVHAATAIALVGVAAYSLVPSPIVAAIWGIGVGANWVTATTALQATIPDARLGRAVALDMIAQTIAQCAGGVVAAMIAGALGASPVVGLSGVGLAVIAWIAIA